MSPTPQPKPDIVLVEIQAIPERARFNEGIHWHYLRHYTANDGSDHLIRTV